MSSKNTRKSNMAKRVLLMSGITCVMFLALVVMTIGFIKVKSDNKQNADKVKELNKSKDSYSKELESVNNEKMT